MTSASRLPVSVNVIELSQPVNVIEMGENGECNRNRIKLMITYSEIKIFSSIVHMTVMEKKTSYSIHVKWVHIDIMYLCVQQRFLNKT